MVSCLCIDQNHGLGWYYRAVPLNVRHCLPRQAHSADGVKTSCFLDDGIYIGDLLFLEAIPPCGLSIWIVPHNVCVSIFLEPLTFDRRQRSDTGSQCTRYSFKPSGHERKADRAHFDSAQLRLFILQDSTRYARLVGSILDHIANLIEQEREVLIASIPQLLTTSVLFVVWKVPQAWYVILIVF